MVHWKTLLNHYKSVLLIQHPLNNRIIFLRLSQASLLQKTHHHHHHRMIDEEVHQKVHQLLMQQEQVFVMILIHLYRNKIQLFKIFNMLHLLYQTNPHRLHMMRKVRLFLLSFGNISSASFHLEGIQTIPSNQSDARLGKFHLHNLFRVSFARQKIFLIISILYL